MSTFQLTYNKMVYNKMPCIFSMYDTLNVKHEPLTLITPEFETPLPPLQPAVSNNKPRKTVLKVILNPTICSK